eukprot:1887893-Alexandrium_andersonii.AAC.1
MCIRDSYRPPGPPPLQRAPEMYFGGVRLGGSPPAVRAGGSRGQQPPEFPLRVGPPNPGHPPRSTSGDIRRTRFFGAPPWGRSKQLAVG